jgi:membrane associated rhomboid family serine protease
VPERELFVVCKECGNEVSPYVTECPYCGNRLRKRAPDIESVRKREQKAKRRADAKRKRAARGRRRGGGQREVPAYLQGTGLPIGITIYIGAAIVLSLLTRVNGFPVLDVIVAGGIAGQPWKLVTSPLVHFGFGYGFVCLMGCAIFGTGLERRFGAVETLAVAIVCGAVGVGLELLFVSVPVVNGANGVALGLMACWLVVVATQEDIRDADTYGLIAIGALLLAMPLATDEASIWAATGGLAAGAACGFALSRVRRD